MNSDSDSQEDGLWNFKLARQFNRAFGSGSEASAATPPPGALDPSLYNPKVNVPKSLGDFDRLFYFCGKPVGLPPPDVRRLSTDSTSSPVSFKSSDHSTILTSEIDDVGLQGRASLDTKIKGVRWHDQVPISGTPKKDRSCVNAAANGSSTTFGLQCAPIESDFSDLESDSENDEIIPAGCDETPSKTSTVHRSILCSPRRPVFIPASVRAFEPISRPPPVSPKLFTDPTTILPFLTLTAKEQKDKLIKKLDVHFAQEPSIPKALLRLGAIDRSGIHVFVDLSNIMIGFFARIKQNRQIPREARIKQPPFAFHSLAMILERGRKVARRVLAGSTISNVYSQSAKRPPHLDEAKNCKYEMNILERVSKPQSLTPNSMKKKRGTGSGYVTSGYSSASESVSINFKTQEQAVDEILQMKMLESLVDYEKPSTIVLASGDAAEAEYSGGFLATVERALSKGWKVEVVAWSQGVSQEYRRKGFLERWKSSFKFINLDDYAEELFAEYTQKYKYAGQ